MKRSSVTIVVVGDSGVGKTSLITTLVSGIFPDTVPSVLQQVRIAPEDTADEIGVLIIDTSSDEAEREQLFDRVVRNADVVVCVHDVTQPETFERLGKVWLDKIISVFQGPIVVVGNKIDLMAPNATSSSSSAAVDADRKDVGESTDRLHAKMRPLLEKYRVDAALDCSAKMNVHVTDLFYYAQHAVIFPVHSLLDTQNGTLLPLFRRALTRIFRFYDEDHDDHLSNTELNTFQEQCFGARLPNDDLDGIRAVLQKESVSFVTAQGITLAGFQFLFQLFVQRNRPETAWSVLRKFSYDDSMEARSNAGTFLKSLSREQSVELTKRGLNFFKFVFHQFDRDNDGTLSENELDEIFSVCGDPGFRPWTASYSTNTVQKPFDRSYPYLGDFPDGCLTNVERTVTLSGWLAQWAMTTCLSPMVTMEQLEMLGYHDSNLSSAVKFTRKRSLEDSDNRLQRTVVRAFCFGKDGVGKSSLLNALVKKNAARGKDAAGAAVDDRARSACGTVRPLDSSSQPANVQASSWFLVLTEVPADQQTAFFSSPARLDCDLAVFLFDPADPSSVEYVQQIQSLVPPTIPCVYLGNKKQQSSDGDVSQGMDAAAALCKAYSLAQPDLLVLEPPVSEQAMQKWSQNMDRLFGLLMSTALFPGAARPISDAQRAIEKQKRMIRSVKRISLVLGVIGGVSYLAYYALSSRKRAGGSESSTSSRDYK